MYKYKVAQTKDSKAHSEHKLLRTVIETMHKEFLRGKKYNIYKYNNLNNVWVRV